ncbi:MAG TPA: hypothetical protein VKU41_04845 [Polyangiaceae bacterium]|nr:hypothetical protein [Polyangiaceae bacterium]
MGEELELVDVNGNTVKVAFHHAIDAIAEKLRGRTPYMTSTVDGEWLKIDLVKDSE